LLRVLFWGQGEGLWKDPGGVGRRVFEVIRGDLRRGRGRGGDMFIFLFRRLDGEVVTSLFC
jgi:hypothetical protein